MFKILPLRPGWMPQSNRILLSLNSKRWQERPTSCPAPRGLIICARKKKISCKIPRDQAKTDVFKPATKLTKISLPKNVFKNSRYVRLPFCPSLPLLHRPTELLLVRATFSQISWYLRHTLERCYIFSQTFFNP